MPTYEYKCTACGFSFERWQSISEPPLEECPQCGGATKRLVSGGSGFLLKNLGGGEQRNSSTCSLEQTGRTCCGRQEKCGEPSCGDKR
jgi:putative FmdB family regulatory protein